MRSFGFVPGKYRAARFHDSDDSGAGEDTGGLTCRAVALEIEVPSVHQGPVKTNAWPPGAPPKWPHMNQVSTIPAASTILNYLDCIPWYVHIETARIG